MGLGFHDFSAGESLTATNVDGYLMRQTVMVFASDAARDAALTGGIVAEGMVCYTTDNDRTYQYSGSAWVVISEPPQTWSVTTITQSGSVSCTTTSGCGWYQRHNGVFTAQLEIGITATGTSSNAITIATPLTLTNLRNLHGTYNFFDASDSFRIFSGVIQAVGTTTFQLASTGLDAGEAAGVAFGATQFTAAVASGDVIRLSLLGRY